MTKYALHGSHVPHGIAVCFCLLLNSQVLLGSELEHPLFRAIKHRQDSQVARLLQQAAPVNLKASDGTTPLMVASLHGSIQSMEMLLDHGSDPNTANDRGVTALHWSASELNKVTLLLRHAANVNARTAKGNTPLLIAAASSMGNEIVPLLLSHGADPGIRNNEGISVLKNAIRSNNTKTMETLFSHAAVTDTSAQLVGDDEAELLRIAALRGTLEMTERLCDHLAELNEGELPGSQAVAFALFAQQPAIALGLMQRGAKPNGLVAPAKAPAITFAAYHDMDDAAVFEKLLELGADVKAKSASGDTALTFARRRGHTQLIEKLLAAGVPDLIAESREIPQRNIRLHAGNQQRLLTEAVTKSVALLQSSGDVFLNKRKSCTACHHHDLPAVAVSWARDRGIPTDHEALQRILRRQAKSNDKYVNRAYEIDRRITNSTRSIGYRLWEYSALGLPPDSATEARVWYLAATQQPDGHWTGNSARPPMGSGNFHATALAIQSIQLFPITARQAELNERIERAANWLSDNAPSNHQERVFQLLGLSWAGKSADELKHLVNGLQQEQNEDGGWAQMPNLPSDAWATGQTLIALRTAGGIDTTEAVYQRGLEFLLSTQFDDGSWLVKSRSFPFQKPFDSGFPHGRDQWISAPATAWATMAMTLAITPKHIRLPREFGAVSQASSIVIETTILAANERTKKPNAPKHKIETISFARDIRPLLERSCIACHTGDSPDGGLKMTNRQALLRGGETGTPAIIPGQSADSLMYLAASGLSDDLQMPPLNDRGKYPGLHAQELVKIRRWIDEGASWPKGMQLVRESKRSTPAKP